MTYVYLDNNATTVIDPRVVEAMLVEMQEAPSNPSSIHKLGKSAHRRLNRARETIATYLHVQPNELIFTSSGTEAITLALLGLHPKRHILTSPIEHASVFQTVQHLEKGGCKVTYLPIDEWGHVQVQDVEAAIRPETDLIILGAVNSETGVKNPITEIAEIAEKRKIPFIVDGVALLGKESFTIPRGVSAMAFSAHKLHGPKGVGLLYVRKGVKLEPLFFGGGQELMRRPGTENLIGIIGFAKAVELLETELPAASLRMAQLRAQLEEGIPGVKVNGTGPRICNLTSLTFPDMDGEALLFQLDMAGIAASMGSACSSGALEPSRVLLQMGLSKKQALSTLRFSLSRFTTEEEISKVIHHLACYCSSP